jgi:hypothetical protein
MNNLVASGRFEKVGSALEERVTEQGLIQTNVEVTYKPMLGHVAGRTPSSGARR